MPLQMRSLSGSSCGTRRSSAAVARPLRLAIRASASRLSSPKEAGNVTQPSRRAVFLSGLAALGLTVLPTERALAEARSIEESVEEYSSLEAAGKLNTAKALENTRAKYGFKRGVDGRVYVKSSKGVYFAVRLDMEVPGALLFRDTSNGQVYALQAETLQQIDLSSDQVVIIMLSDGDWEKDMSPIMVEDEEGKSKTLTLSEAEFRNVVGLIAQAQQEDDTGKE